MGPATNKKTTNYIYIKIRLGKSIFLENKNKKKTEYNAYRTRENTNLIFLGLRYNNISYRDFFNLLYKI